jgi:hypothetical protein
VMVFVRGSPKFRPLIHGITLGIRDLRSAGLVMMILQVVYVDPKVSRLLPAIPDDWGGMVRLKKKSQSLFVGATRIFGCLKAEKANEAWLFLQPSNWTISW